MATETQTAGGEPEVVPAEVAEPQGQVPPKDAEAEQVEANLEEPDWKSRFEQTERENADLKQQRDSLRSQEIGSLRQSERDEVLFEVRDNLAFLSDSIQKGEIEEFPQKMAERQAQRQRQSANSAFNDAQNSAYEAVTTIGESLRLNPQTAQEFETTRLYWSRALRDGDPYWMARVQAEAALVESRVLRHSSTSTVETARREGKAAGKREALEESGALEQNLGPGAGGGTGSDDETWGAYGRGEIPWSQKVQDVGRRLGML